RELRYGLDLSLNRQDGVMRGSARNTAFGSVDLMYRTRKIAMRNELSITHNRGINSPLGSFSAFAAMNPYFRHTDEQGRIQPVAGQTLVTGVVANPLWNEMIHTKDDSYYFQMANNFYLDWFVN